MTSSAVEGKNAHALRSAKVADCQVHPDPKQPGIWRCFAAKCVDFLQPAGECFLRQLAGFLGFSNHPQQGVEQTVLIEDHDLAKSGAVSPACLEHEGHFLVASAC